MDERTSDGTDGGVSGGTAPEASPPSGGEQAPNAPAAQTAQPAQPQSLSQCVPVPGRRFQLLALGQSIFSALCIFFIALALRNYFQLK
jgi:hypothetical protein